MARKRGKAGEIMFTFQFSITLHVVIVGKDHKSLYPQNCNHNTIVALINRLNKVMSHTVFHFVFDPKKDLEEICDVELNTDKKTHMERERLSRKNPDKITLIFRDGNNSYSGAGSYYVVLSKNIMRHPTKLAHELGHYFHLSHTFPIEVVDVQALRDKGLYKKAKKAKEDIKKGKLLDIKHLLELIRHYVEVEKHPVDEGLKALEIFMDGDKEKVHDTPYDLGAKIFDTYPGGPCAKKPRAELKVNFSNGSQKTYYYEPRTRSNIMSYFDSCFGIKKYHFSEDQKKVMYRASDHGNRIRLFRGKDWDSSNMQDFVSPAAVSRKSDTVAVFANNEEGVMMMKSWDPYTHSYKPSESGGWLSLGGEGLISPVAISRNPDVIDLFAKDITGLIANKILNEASSTYWPGPQAWSKKHFSVGVENKPAVVSPNPSALQIFCRMPDGTIETKKWDKEWGQWQKLGGKGVGAPAAVCPNYDTINLFARWSDGSIRTKTWDEQKNQWSPINGEWTNLGGKGYDAPAVVAMGCTIGVFIRWDDGTIRYKVGGCTDGLWLPGKKAWANLGGKAVSEPVIVCRSSKSVDIFTRWTDGTVRLRVWHIPESTWWPGDHWYNLGGDTVGRPAALARNENRVIIYARWLDNSIRTKVWNGEFGQWWPGTLTWHHLGTP